MTHQKRRVIFPGNDYWTQPKENNMTANFNDPAVVAFPEDTVVLAAEDLYGRLFAAPNNTLGVGIQFRDATLGHFLVALTPDEIQGIHQFLGQLMALPPDEIAALRDRVHQIQDDQ
ncbi:hypothetical protein [Mycolicibacterium austroafricanum]|uniref:hypothetical protein n=1 Tax=Mycolicibacterium austroafricanum TaxID=39687 RepID=UPI001CA30CDC|nr:hypothetical protein [Mycolicibacterium austroafricanum]QZT56731.1 hypothetical protein JN084_28205 [Mycolicibacterium austroafricanum]